MNSLAERISVAEAQDHRTVLVLLERTGEIDHDLVAQPDDVFERKPIRVRYLWSNPSTTPHWEQACSEDGGKTWETNWTMDFTRTQ